MMLSITMNEFKQISHYVKSHYGIDLKDEKQTLVATRLHHVLQQFGLANFTDFYKHVQSDKSGESAAALVDKITTNHTYFMREADHFDFFRDQVLPYLEQTVRDKDLRIWCAACSSGEESATLAMLMDEFFGRDKMGWDTRLLATDLSGKMLDIAQKGIYPNERIAPLPAHWRSAYFKKLDPNNSILTDKIRNNMIYRKFNLMDSVFPFKKKFHTIFCRNVMIYFDQKTRMELIDKFYNHMEYGGYLFIGHSESIYRDATKFKYIMPSVYRKI